MAGNVPGASKKGVIILYSVVAVIVVALIGGALWAAKSSKSDTGGSGSGAAPASAVGTAIPVGSGPVTVDVYEDFQCPACGQAEKAIGEQLAQRAADGKVTLNYHMMSFLGPESARAANASFCAADAGKFAEMHAALYAEQPPENTGGYTQDDLLATGARLGLPASYDECVKAGTYAGFADRVTSESMAAGVKSTPTYVVAGKPVTGTTSWQQILDAVDAAAAASPAAASPAPASVPATPAG